MDGYKILLDCGWNDHLDVAMLAPLAEVAPSVDAVLVSHPDTAHLGALPYAFGKLGMRCKVYATLPVHKMGMMFMYDQYLARHNDGDFDLFSLDDVDAAFGAFVPVRYAQHSTLEHRNENGANETKTSITVTAFAAGHTLGGAVWKVHKDAEDVVYAVDYNHRKEKHLNGMALQRINRPSLLITDAFNARGATPAKSRDNDVMDAILRSVRQDGNVLIPVDPAGRVLELMLMLEERWAKQQLGAYQLVLLTTVAYNTLEFARSHLEWMGENVGRNFDRDRLNAFNTRYLTLCHSVDEFSTLRQGPKVVLASFGSLEAGPARRLFTEWATDPRNLIVLTDRGLPGSLAREVRELSTKPPGTRNPLQVSLSHRIPLEGDELIAWRAQREAKCSASAGEAPDIARGDSAAAELKTMQAMDLDNVDTREVGEQDIAAESHLSVAKVTGSGAIAADLRRRRCLIDGFAPPGGTAAPMYPDEIWEPDMTDFGESVNTTLFAQVMTESSSAAPGVSDAAIAQAEGDAANAAAAAAAAAKRASIPAPAPPPPPEEHPTKVVEEVVDVHLRAAVHVCDYEGRADGRSVRTMVTHIEPRKVVLVHGTPDDTAFLTESLRTSLPGIPVDAPPAGKPIDCTSNTAMYRLELSQDLLGRTRLRDVAGYQVGWVDGVVGFQKDVNGNDSPVLMAPKQAQVANISGIDTSPETQMSMMSDETTKTAETLPIEKSAGVGTAVTAAAAAVAVASAASRERRLSAFIGDLKLSDFKLVLAAAKIPAEFSGGALVCAGGTVCVRKIAGTEDLIVEGAISEEFYQVRDILYRQYRM